VKIPPATEAEVKQAIRKLNNGKAADENGIQAEHFKFANAELATEICLDACSIKPLCKGFCVGDSCFSNRSLMTDSIIF
jgi:radical SAM protein with 4Fe4S-binding SPASM domain